MNSLLLVYIVSAYLTETLKQCNNKINVSFPEMVSKSENVNVRWDYKKPTEWKSAYCRTYLYAENEKEKKLYKGKKIKNKNEAQIKIPNKLYKFEKKHKGAKFKVAVICKGHGDVFCGEKYFKLKE